MNERFIYMLQPKPENGRFAKWETQEKIHQRNLELSANFWDVLCL